MYYPCLVALFGLAAGVHSHGVILAVAGEKGSPDSQGFLGKSICWSSICIEGPYVILILAILVNTTLPRNCINISPCQQDTTILRDEEMNQNIVNTCGRTELAGNVDVGQETEKELAANRVTSVQKGSTLAVTIHQVGCFLKELYIYFCWCLLTCSFKVNADGAGPYTCDMDPTSKSKATQLLLGTRILTNVTYRQLFLYE